MGTNGPYLGSHRTAIITILVISLAATLAIISVAFFLLRPVLPPFFLDCIVYASLFGLMAIGLNLTYITTKVPNFAYGSFVTVGIYTSYTMLRINHIIPYYSAPLAFALGGFSSIVMYLAVLRVLARRGSSLVSLMIATLAVDIAFIAIFGIYSDYLSSSYRIIDTKYFIALSATPGADFALFGYPGILYVAPLTLASMTGILYLLLSKTRFGISLRASVENPDLARVLGIDVERAYIFAWFIGGGFAGMAGSYYSLWLPGGTSAGSNLIVEIFAASVLGGLASVYGGAIGGLIIGASEILVTQAGIELLGSWVQIYQKGVPLVMMVLTLLLFPRGLVSVHWSSAFRKLGRAIERISGGFSRIILRSEAN